MATNWEEIVRTRLKLVAIDVERIQTRIGLYLYVRQQLPWLPAVVAQKLCRRYERARQLHRDESIVQDRLLWFVRDCQNAAAISQNIHLDRIARYEPETDQLCTHITEIEEYLGMTFYRRINSARIIQGA